MNNRQIRNAGGADPLAAGFIDISSVFYQYFVSEVRLMKTNRFLPAVVAWLLVFVPLSSVAGSARAAESASGEIVHGYRVLSVAAPVADVKLTVYRGDYIKFKFDPSVGEPVLSIPGLSISAVLPENPNIDAAPYFKMKTTGSFPFALGRTTGVIEVVEFERPNYRAVSPKEAAELIDKGVFVLDVRTPAEYKQGHLENAVLIPVQELQKRLHELADRKSDDILIYCATGNRSTVASKILLDNEFKHVINLQKGIRQWTRENYPVIK